MHTGVPFADRLGLRRVALGQGHAELQLEPQEWLLNSWDVVHGGVVMTLLDVAMAHAARSLNAVGDDLGPGVVTVEMKTTFMRPSEGPLRAVASVLHRSTTMAYTEASVFNAQGQRCAHATGTFKYLRALPSGRGLKTLRPPTGTDTA